MKGGFALALSADGLQLSLGLRAGSDDSFKLLGTVRWFFFFFLFLSAICYSL